MWRKYDKHSAIYHTKSKIENLHFSVSLKNISSLIKVPKFEKTSDVQSLSLDNDELIGELEIKWQEKVFSSVEVEVYSDVENCSKEVQRKYHNLIRDGENVRQGKIFTYVQEDNFTPSEELLCHTESKRSIPYKKETPDPNEEEVMYVYASLSPDVLLFEVRWRAKEGVLIVCPDFNDCEDNPYYIEIDSDYRHLYSYTVKNTSPSLDMLSAKLEKNMKLGTRPIIDIDRIFDMPPKHSTRFLVLLEIQSASFFEYENLHIRYKISIPDRFILEEGELMGSTHSSVSLNSIWKFGHCFQFAILSSTKVPINENFTIYLEAISIDSWTRERPEGFAFYTIELRPQQIQVEIPCFRVDYGLLERIERFFIGGRRHFDLEKFCSGNDGMLNRYHTKTISTGSLIMQCQIIMQRNDDLARGINLDNDLCVFKLEDVLKKHHEARVRLESVV